MTAILLSLDSLQAQYPAIYFWIDSFFKASFIIALALLFHWIYRRQSASTHGLIWLIAIISCLCIPFFKLVIPDIDLIVSLEGKDYSDSGNAITAINKLELSTLESLKDLVLPVLVYSYLAGLLIMLTNLSVSITRLFGISRQACDKIDSESRIALQELMQSNGIASKVTLLVSSQTSTPFTWGVFHHRLVLPETAKEWNRQLLRQAIGHELGHIQRNDWIYQLLGQLTLCFYWPNPLLWHAAKCLKIASEKASDDTAADCSGSDVGYASSLLQLASCVRIQDRNTQSAMTMFSTPSILSQRIHHILVTDRNRSLLRSDEILTATLMTLLLIVPFSSVQVSANMVEPTKLEQNYLPLSSLETVERVSFPDFIEPESVIPPQSLQRSTAAPQLRSALLASRMEFDPVTETLSLHAGDIIDLSAAELFQQWEATPLQTPSPEYPQVALRKGIEGYVVAEFDLDKKGNAVNPRIIESVPTGTFDKAVLRAVEKYVYCPEIVDGIGGNNQPIRKRFSFALQN